MMLTSFGSFLCLFVLFCALTTSLSPDDVAGDLAQSLLDEFESKTGLSWPCYWWPSGQCACHQPAHCLVIDSCSDCGCGSNYCFCSQCDDGYVLQSSSCGSGSD